MLKRAYTWTKKKLLWFFLGGVALAAGIPFLPAECAVEDNIPGEVSYFAHIGADGVVDQTIVADKSFICSRTGGNDGNWVRTSEKGSVRKNMASVGYTYDENRDVFIPPKHPEATIFNEEKAVWERPVSTTSNPVSSTTPR